MADERGYCYIQLVGNRKDVAMDIMQTCHYIGEKGFSCVLMDINGNCPFSEGGTDDCATISYTKICQSLFEKEKHTGRLTRVKKASKEDFVDD